jgi:hypothetical protein
MTNDRIERAASRGPVAFVVAGALAAVASAAVILVAGVVPAADAQQAATPASRAPSAAAKGPAMRAASLETGPSTARATWTDSDVYDAGAYWHFARLDGFYRIEGHVVACVQKADGHWDFWDPQRDALLGTRNLDCLPPAGSRGVDATIVSHRLTGSPGSVESDASFYGATGVWYDLADFQHCQTAFDHVYTAEGPGSQGYAFYVIEKLRHARPVDLDGQACGMVPGVVTLRYTPRYDDTPRVQALDLGDHRTLIATRDDDDHPVIVVIHDRPARIWTGAQGVSIVPAALLQPALDQAGPDFAARERVVVQLLASAR